jgi:hypothetical protein
MKTVDFRWPPERIKAFCEKETDWIFEIPDDVSAEDLAELYRRQVTSPARYNAVIAEIAGHANTPVETLDEMLTAFGDDEEITSALATNPSTPVAVLRILKGSRFESVRTHAEQSLERLKT